MGLIKMVAHRMEYKIDYKRELKGKMKRKRNGGKGNGKRNVAEKCEESEIRDRALRIGREV